VAGVTALMLLAGSSSGLYVNLSLSAHDVGGRIMPPGMIMDFDTPAGHAGHVAIHRGRSPIEQARMPRRHGLEPRIENGVKVFDIEASVIRWTILDEVEVDAYAFNRQVPGPRLLLVDGIAYGSISETRCLNRPRCTGTASSFRTRWTVARSPRRRCPPAGATATNTTVEQSARSSITPRPCRSTAGFGCMAPLDRARGSTQIRADLEYTIQLQEWLKRDGSLSRHADGRQPAEFFTINGKAYHPPT